jgi:hypothetical protein
MYGEQHVGHVLQLGAVAELSHVTGGGELPQFVFDNAAGLLLSAHVYHRATRFDQRRIAHDGSVKEDC